MIKSDFSVWTLKMVHENFQIERLMHHDSLKAWLQQADGIISQQEQLFLNILLKGLNRHIYL